MLEDNDGRSILRLDPATELDLGIYKVVARNKFGQTTARARLVEIFYNKKYLLLFLFIFNFLKDLF